MVSFTMLWRFHPANQTPPEEYPCRDKDNNPCYEHQCAVRMGVALQLAGISIASYHGSFCWHGHDRTHILVAQELADWLSSNPYIAGQPSVAQKVTNAKYNGKKGIVFFRNFYGQNNLGDHIDVWNGARMGMGASWYFGRSEEVRFWELL
jgi:hypothetical protein